MVHSHHGARPAQTYNGSPERLKIQECWQVQPVVGGIGNGVTEEVLGWSLNERRAATRDNVGQ